LIIAIARNITARNTIISFICFAIIMNPESTHPSGEISDSKKKFCIGVINFSSFEFSFVDVSIVISRIWISFSRDASACPIHTIEKKDNIRMKMRVIIYKKRLIVVYR
jgi:hypothetical protein